MTEHDMAKAIERGCFVFDRTQDEHQDHLDRYGRPVGYGWGDRFAVPLLYGDGADGSVSLCILSGRATRREDGPDGIYTAADIGVVEYPSMKPRPDIMQAAFPADERSRWNDRHLGVSSGKGQNMLGHTIRLGGMRRVTASGPDVVSAMRDHLEHALSQPAVTWEKPSVGSDFAEFYEQAFYYDFADSVEVWETHDEAFARAKEETTSIDVLNAFEDRDMHLMECADGQPALRQYILSLKLRAMEDVRDGMAQRRGDTVDLCKGNRLYRLKASRPAGPGYPKQPDYSLSHGITDAYGTGEIRTEISGLVLAPVFAAMEKTGLENGFPGKADILAAGNDLDDLYGVFHSTMEKLMDTPFPDLAKGTCIRMTKGDMEVSVSRSGISMEKGGRTVSETEAWEGGPALTAAGAWHEFERLLSAEKTGPVRHTARQNGGIER